MRLYSLFPVIAFCSLALAGNEGTSRWKFWNTTTVAQQTTASIGSSSVNNSSPFEVAATVQIQIGELIGSGVISFSDISLEVFTPNSTVSGVPYQTDSQFTSPKMTPPYTNTTSPHQTRPPLNLNATWGHISSQSLVRLASTTSPTELGLSTGSGVQVNRSIPRVLAIFTAIVILML